MSEIPAFPFLELFTIGGVRLRLRHDTPGDLNWLLLPGGPGVGSDSLFELADLMAVPGRIWMVDLPGDGDNLRADDCFAHWPGVLSEALDVLPHCVYLGHSTGGMYLLDTPDLESQLAGLVLVSAAPDARWHPRFLAMSQENPLAAVDAAAIAYAESKTNDKLADIAIASAEWNFTPPFVTVGRELLERMPYNFAAVDWSDVNFDPIYVSKWWPKSLPTLIISGACDRIVDQSLWDEARFAGPHVMHRSIADAGHFPWLENPGPVRAVFTDFAAKLTN